MRKLFSLFAALTLCAGLMAETVPYIDANGQPQTANDVTEITNATSQDWWSEGWYVVKGEDVQLAKGAVCNGEVHLILADGAKLTATGDYGWNSSTPGIQVSGEGNSLTIYAQTEDITQMGQLIANGGTDGGAGIGGGYEGSGSNITINGGKITAKGSLGAGIGGGFYGEGSHITINGGSVTATGEGDNGGAGIGGGYYGEGSHITINGGKVIATGSDYAAGIGGGMQGSGSNITINGGEVTANGNATAAGIGGGGGFYQTGSYIIINGGTVIANGGEEAGAGIGGGGNGIGSYITITGGTVTANGGYDATSIGNGANAEDAAHDILVATSLVVKADGNYPPAMVIENDGSDLANKLAGKPYATITISLPAAKDAAVETIDAAIAGVTDVAILAIAAAAKTNINAATTVEDVEAIMAQALADIAAAIFAKYKADAIAEIQTAGAGIQNAEMNNWINGAITDINAAGTDTKEKVDNIKNQILSMIQLFQDGKTEGDAAGYARAQDELPTEGTSGPAVTITKGDKTVIFYNTDKVEYSIVDAD